MLQCVKCVAVRCMCCSRRVHYARQGCWYVAVCCSASQCCAVCYSVLQCVAVRCSVLQLLVTATADHRPLQLWFHRPLYTLQKTSIYTAKREREREIILFFGKLKGKSSIISNDAYEDPKSDAFCDRAALLGSHCSLPQSPINTPNDFYIHCTDACKG